MMIRALVRKQLRELGAAFLRSSKTGKARSRASAVGYALLFAVLVVVLMLCFAGMALPLASVLLPAGLDWLYFASMGLTALLVSVLASAFTSYSGLFQSRDNELLLSLPIPPAVIFGVRVSTVYLACLIYLLMAWVPAVVCYGLLAAHPLAGVLCSIPMALVLAGAACILAVLLGWAVALANDRARHNILPLSKFGLMQITRQRVRPALDIVTSEKCPSCYGKGEVQPSLLFTDVLKEKLDYLINNLHESGFTMYVHPYVDAYLKKGLLSLYRKWKMEFGSRFKILPDQSLAYLQYRVIDSKKNEIDLAEEKDMDSSSTKSKTKAKERNKNED